MDGRSGCAGLCKTSKRACGFFFFIFKKKIKNICPFWKISKIYPGRPMGGDRAQMYFFFFFKFATKSLEQKKRGGLSPPQRATGPCRHPRGDRPVGPAYRAGRPSRGRQGGLSPPPPAGDRVNPPYIRPPPSFPPHLTSKNPPKIQKKERGEEKGSGEALPNSALVIYW